MAALVSIGREEREDGRARQSVSSCSRRNASKGSHFYSPRPPLEAPHDDAADLHLESGGSACDDICHLTTYAAPRHTLGVNAVKLHSEKLVYDDGAIREEVVWRVPSPVPPSGHGYKYRLVYIVNGARVIGYDNERGKGDHDHRHGIEQPYAFRGLAEVIAD